MGISQNVLVIAVGIDCRSDEIEPEFTVRHDAEHMPPQGRAKSIS